MQGTIYSVQPVHTYLSYRINTQKFSQYRISVRAVGLTKFTKILNVERKFVLLSSLSSELEFQQKFVVHIESSVKVAAIIVQSIMRNL